MTGMPDQGQLIRVSCAALCRIEHSGRYLLLLNHNRRQKGVYVLSPPGGALALYDRAILAACDAHLEDPASLELRLHMPEGALPHFREWFRGGQGRERSPYRELHEELVVETALLPALAPADVSWSPLRTVEDRALTTRQGKTGFLTHYFLELYGVHFTAMALTSLLAPPANSGAVWVTAAQIAEGRPLQLSFDGARREVIVRGELVIDPD